MESGLSDVFNSDLIQAWEDNGRLLTWFYQLAAGIAACPVLPYTVPPLAVPMEVRSICPCA